MAISIASQGAVADWFANASSKSVTISWSAGDVIVVIGLMENAAPTLNNPTATGLTFTARQVSTGTGSGESYARGWTAKAAAGGSSVSLAVSRNGGTNERFGFYYWVLSGGDDYTTGGNATTGTDISLTVPAGGFVAFGLSDWDASAYDPAAATGSGTASERVDTNNTSFYGVYVYDWLGTASGTFGFGLTPYTGMQPNSVAIAVAEGTAPAAVRPVRPIVASTAGAVRRLLGSGRALLDRAPASPAPPRRPLISRPFRRPPPPANRATVIRAPQAPTPAPPPRRPIVAVARRAAVAAGRAVIARAPLAPPAQQLPTRPPVVITSRRQPPAGRARLLRAPQAQRAYSLLNTFAPSSADPHSLTITGATAGRDVYLVVNCAATIATPAGWELVTSRVATMGSYIYRLPGTSNPGGSIGVSLDLSAARAVAVAAIQAPYADTAATYASLVAPVNGPGSTAFGTGAHTFTAHEAVFAIYNFHSATGLPTFNATGYDQGFGALADTGWAGAGTGGDEGARILIGSAEAVGFSAGGVVVSLDAAGPTGSAVGFLALNAGTPPAVDATTGRRPIVVAARRAVAAGRAFIARAPQVPAPTARPVVVAGRRRAVSGRVLIRRATAAAPVAAARRPAPIVVVARARARAGEILTLRAPAEPVEIVSVPGAPQVTETRHPRPRTRPAIVVRNRATTTPTPAGPREPLVITSTRRPLARIILRRNPAQQAAAATPRARPALVVARQRRSTGGRVALRRNPAAPLAATVTRARVLVVVARARRRSTPPVLMWSAPPAPSAPPGPGAQWFVSRGGALVPYRALLDGVHPTITDVT